MHFSGPYGWPLVLALHLLQECDAFDDALQKCVITVMGAVFELRHYHYPRRPIPPMRGSTWGSKERGWWGGVEIVGSSRERNRLMEPQDQYSILSDRCRTTGRNRVGGIGYETWPRLAL